MFRMMVMTRDFISEHFLPTWHKPLGKLCKNGN